MRGNWEAAEALVLAPGQQLQQQQHSIMEEQRLPLHSPTTPAWGGITDRIVKEEPVEDKNNDSGVSPGHYTSNSASPRSRRSSSTANCSLSPGSATSQDSNAMQCVNFDYSPQSIYKNCGSPLDYGRIHSMDEMSQHQQNEHQAMDVVSSSMKSGCEESEVGQDTLQCPACPFTTSNRLQFTEHLAAHYAAKCETPDFTKSLLTGNEIINNHDDHHQQQQQQQQQQPQQQQQQLQQIHHSMNAMSSMDEDNRASPSQGERSEQESEEADEPGLRVPRVNSQGKVKTFRCKQCNFVAITKLEFWEHSRGHIKAEKLLTCPKCPFVTEYKHHLEYHLRNHFGSKPFKCDKCSYSCVNKSMLNSHLKSHSNVYQYRCANCSYATKYCHSLKLHLRKYSHKPAMVLNADGSPNPLPIIDVYGTRRGPKQKPTNGIVKSQEDNSQIANADLTSPGQTCTLSGQLVVQPQISPVGHRIPINPISAMHALSNGVSQAVIPFSYGQMFTGFPISNHYNMSDEATEKHLEHLKTNIFAEYAKAIAGDRMNVDHPQDVVVNGFNSPSLNVNGSNSHEIVTTINETGSKNSNDSETSRKIEPEITMENKSTPLDLSKPDVVANNNNNSNENNNIQLSEKIQTNGTNSNTNSPRASGTSRRKGRAVKLDRRVVEEETDEERDRDTENFEGSSVVDQSCSNVEIVKENSPERSCGGIGMSNEFTCQYCEIAFGNVVMYTVHMGYHGYKNPYTCNMCGHESEDKVSFFLHIARSKHT